MNLRTIFVALFVALSLSACGLFTTPPTGKTGDSADASKGHEVAMYAMSLIDTGYRFGGKNPEAGLDCSGMVSYIYNRVLGLKLIGSAADMARRGNEISKSALQPGDLVFFNTRNFSFSHVGIYIGDARFVHAPSSNGRVRIDTLDSSYYAKRFELARRYF